MKTKDKSEAETQEQINAMKQRLEDMLKIGHRMLDDDGERLALRYVGFNVDMILHVKDHQHWAMIQLEGQQGKILTVTDCVIFPEDFPSLSAEKDSWKLIGKTNAPSDIFGFFNADCSIRDDSASDSRLHYMTPVEAFKAARDYLLSTPATRAEIKEQMKREGLEMIEYARRRLKELYENFPIKPSDHQTGPQGPAPG